MKQLETAVAEAQDAMEETEAAATGLDVADASMREMAQQALPRALVAKLPQGTFASAEEAATSDGSSNGSSAAAGMMPPLGGLPGMAGMTGMMIHLAMEIPMEMTGSPLDHVGAARAALRVIRCAGGRAEASSGLAGVLAAAREAGSQAKQTAAAQGPGPCFCSTEGLECRR